MAEGLFRVELSAGRAARPGPLGVIGAHVQASSRMSPTTGARTRYPGAAPPETVQLPRLAEAAAGCQGWDLYENATQTVFGAGPRLARLMLVGEQPGDVEDREGAPFVGPAGRELDRALAAAGLEREALYVTNAVKHFRWKRAARGKRRIHDKPSAGQVSACRPWLAAELAAVEPTVVVALGATAAQSLFGPQFRLTAHRGEPLDWPPEEGPFAGDGTDVHAALATIHPSAVLRARGDAERRAAFDGLVSDLSAVRGLLDTR
jgi:DNA polymerase